MFLQFKMHENNIIKLLELDKNYKHFNAKQNFYPECKIKLKNGSINNNNNINLTYLYRG